MTSRDQELGRLIQFIVQYVFEHDDGNIDADFCLPEIAAGRCSRQGKEDELDIARCTQCLTELFEAREKKVAKEREMGHHE